MLEPCAGKLACTVLRGLGAGNSSRLPDLYVPVPFFLPIIIQYIVVMGIIKVVISKIILRIPGTCEKRIDCDAGKNERAFR